LAIAQVIDAPSQGVCRVDLKQLIEGRIGGLHPEVGLEDEEWVPDGLNDLLGQFLGVLLGLHALRLGRPRRFERGDALA
jgi:hypothetical protein